MVKISIIVKSLPGGSYEAYFTDRPNVVSIEITKNEAVANLILRSAEEHVLVAGNNLSPGSKFPKVYSEPAGRITRYDIEL